MSDLIDLCDSSDGEDFGRPPSHPSAKSVGPNNGGGRGGVKVEGAGQAAPGAPDSEVASPTTLLAAKAAATIAGDAATTTEPSPVLRAAAVAAANVMATAKEKKGPSPMSGPDGTTNNNTGAAAGGARSLRDDVEAERDNDGGGGAKKAAGGGVSQASTNPAEAGNSANPAAAAASAAPSAHGNSANPAVAAASAAAPSAHVQQQQQPPPAAAVPAAPSDGSSSDETPTIQDEPPTTAITLPQLRSRFESLPPHVRSRYSYGLSIDGLLTMGEGVAREIMELALGDADVVAVAGGGAANAAASGTNGGDGPCGDDGDIDAVPIEEEDGNTNNVGGEDEDDEDDDEEMDDDLRKALELSKQTAREEADQRARYRHVLASMSPPGKGPHRNRSANNNGDDNNNDFDDEEIDMSSLQIRTHISRPEFDVTVESIIRQMGGWDKIDNGRLVKAGNMKIQRSDMAAGGGMAQTRAQYGRYTCEGFWRLIDVLEGRVEADLRYDHDDDDGGGDGGGGGEKKGRSNNDEEHSDKDENNAEMEPSAGDDFDVEDDRKLPAVPDSDEDQERSTPPRSARKRKRRNVLPDARPIRAHVDIGHGIGIQVLQAGLGLGIVSRGVEIMKGRQVVAEIIRENLVTCLRRDPPDMSRIEMHHKDFSRACLPDDETGKCDEWLRTHLLCRDLSEEEQKGLVIFVNNAREIFAARSCNTRGISAPLDAHLAELFGNMKVGGRMVTLEDISSHLHQNANWFRRDVFQSGSEAVSWGGKSIEIFVLTKLRDDWTCQNKDCPSKKDFFEFGGAVTSVVKSDGKLSDMCLYCEGGPKRTNRKRTRNAKYAE